MTDRAPLRCAYIVGHYPSITHTFVLREVLALRERGLDIAPVTVRWSEDIEKLAPADRSEAKNTHAILPTTPWQVVRAHVDAFRKAPGGYIRTLAESLWDAPPGIRAKAWQFFYFVEGMMLWRWLQERDLRHVHAHHANVGADLAMIATRFGNRAGSGPRMTWSFTVHGPRELTNVGTHKLGVKVERADAVVATSDFVRAQLMALVDPPHRTRIRTIHVGVRPGSYYSAKQEPVAGRPIQLLSVAQLEPRKGQETLMEALAQLRHEGKGVELTIVGDGPARGDVEQRAAELGLTDVVTFVGALGQDEVGSFYSSADVFCLPSFSEGLPTVLMEAMASGLPVVATAIMGVPELVQNGCGLVVPPGRPDSLAEALGRLISDPELRSVLGEAGRRKVVAEFNIEQTAAELQTLFREVISPGDG